MLEILTDRLARHEEHDRQEFNSIQSTLEKIDSKLDSLTEKVVRLDTIREVTKEEASKAGAWAGSKWAVLLGTIIAGVANACSFITYGNH